MHSKNILTTNARRTGESSPRSARSGFQSPFLNLATNSAPISKKSSGRILVAVNGSGSGLGGGIILLGWTIVLFNAPRGVSSDEPVRRVSEGLDSKHRAD